VYSEGSLAWGGRARGRRLVMRRLRVVWRVLSMGVSQYLCDMPGSAVRAEMSQPEGERTVSRH
jgi:hypothetical protein